MVSSWLVSRVSGADVGPERSGALLGWSAGRSHTPSRSHFHVVRRTTEPSRECKNSAPRVPAALKMPALNQREAGDGRKLAMSAADPCPTGNECCEQATTDGN